GGSPRTRAGPAAVPGGYARTSCSPSPRRSADDVAAPVREDGDEEDAADDDALVAGGHALQVDDVDRRCERDGAEDGAEDATASSAQRGAADHGGPHGLV